MALEASDIVVRVKLQGGTAFEADAAKVAGSVDTIGAAGKKAQEAQMAASSRLGTAGAAVAGFGSKLDKAGRSVTGFGRALTPLSVVTGFGFYEGAKAAAAFNKQMTLLVTQAYLARRHLPGLSSDILKMSTKLGVSPVDLAMGAYPITSDLTRNPKKIASDLSWAAKMAVIGGDTPNNTANFLTSILATRLGSQYTPGRVAGMAESAIGQGKMRMADLTQSLSSGIMPLVKAFGGQFPQVLASVAALAREGVPPSQAANRLRLTLSSVANPTVAGVGAMQQMGMSKFALASDLRKGGLLGMLEQIQLHTADMSANKRNELIGTIFGKSRGASMIESLLNNVPQIQNILNKITSAGPGLVNYHLGISESTPAQKQARIQAQFQVAMITLGKSVNKYLLPMLMNLAHDATSIVTSFGKLPDWAKKLIVDFGAVIIALAPASLVLGGTMTAIGKLVGGFGRLLKWTGVLAGADKVAAGENGVGGLSSSIKRSGLLGNLTKLGLTAGVVVAAYEAYDHRKQIAHFVSGTQKTTVAGGWYRDLFGAGGVFNRDKFGEQFWKNAPYSQKKYIDASVQSLKSFGDNPKDLSMTALADPHFSDRFGKAIGESIATYLNQHPNAHVGETHHHLIVDGKEIAHATDKHHRKKNNRR